MMLSNDIIDQIYEAAFLPQFWPIILDKLAALVEAPASLIFTSDQFRHVRWVANPFFRPLVQAYVDGGFMTTNRRPERFLAASRTGFINDVDVLTPDEIARDPAYALFLRPAGIGCTAGTVLALTSGELLIFDFTRRLDRGPFERRFLALLDSASPHLARAAMLATRLKMEQAKTAAETLAILGLAGAVISSNARVLAANDLFNSLSPQLQIGAGNRPRLAAAEADGLLQQGLETSTKGGVVRSIAVPAAGDRPAFVLHLLPIRRGALDIFASAATIVVAMPLGKPIAPAIGLLNDLFDLTPAEARVARLLCDGEPAQQIAVKLSISLETVRSHVKRTLAKTGTHRQTDLIRLLAGVTPPGGQ